MSLTQGLLSRSHQRGIRGAHHEQGPRSRCSDQEGLPTSRGWPPPLPRLSRSDIRWQFRERCARQVALARSSGATTGEMCQSRARADSAEAAGVSRGRGLLGGADAERTPLADSPRAMQASLDTLFRPAQFSAVRDLPLPARGLSVQSARRRARQRTSGNINRPPTAAGGSVTTASLSRRASASAARSCATLRRSHRSGIG